MKKFALLGLVLAMLSVLTVHAAPEGAIEDAPENALPPGQTRTVIPVTGMTCGGCCVAIETAVKKLDGIVAVKADYEKGRATVTYEEDKLTVKKIVETINMKTSFKASMPEKTG